MQSPQRLVFSTIREVLLYTTLWRHLHGRCVAYKIVAVWTGTIFRRVALRPRPLQSCSIALTPLCVLYIARSI